MDKKKLVDLEKALSKCLKTFQSGYSSSHERYIGSNKSERNKSLDICDSAQWFAFREVSNSNVYTFLEGKGIKFGELDTVHEESKPKDFESALKKLLDAIETLK